MESIPLLGLDVNRAPLDNTQAISLNGDRQIERADLAATAAGGGYLKGEPMTYPIVLTYQKREGWQYHGLVANE